MWPLCYDSTLIPINGKVENSLLDRKNKSNTSFILYAIFLNKIKLEKDKVSHKIKIQVVFQSKY